jgi:hypothetical protein
MTLRSGAGRSPGTLGVERCHRDMQLGADVAGLEITVEDWPMRDNRW